MSVREFAAHLGVSDRMVSKWEAGGRGIRPRPINQQALDTSLRQADPEAQERFYAAMASRPPVVEQTAVSPSDDLQSMSDTPRGAPPCRESPPCDPRCPSYGSEDPSSPCGDMLPSCENGFPTCGYAMRSWEIVVPIRVTENEAVEITARRIATAVAWLPGVQVDGLRIHRRDHGARN